MSKGVKGCIALAASCAMVGAAAPLSFASGASLKVKAPTAIKRSKRFNVVVSGTAKFKRNYLAIFYDHSMCKSTYAAENVPGIGPKLSSAFVGKTFKVTMLSGVKGGIPGTGFFCTYLYPAATGTAWATKKPEVRGTHRITFT